MRRPRPGREGFWRVHVPDYPDAIGELQPSPKYWPRTWRVLRDTVLDQLGHNTCSRFKTVKFEVDGHGDIESYLSHWVVHGLYDPDVRNKEQHMQLPRENLGPWIDSG